MVSEFELLLLGTLPHKPMMTSQSGQLLWLKAESGL
jgi:hypothetical protein